MSNLKGIAADFSRISSAILTWQVKLDEKYSVPDVPWMDSQPKMPMKEGGVICLTETLLPLTEKISVIPVGLI